LGGAGSAAANYILIYIYDSANIIKIGLRFRKVKVQYGCPRFCGPQHTSHHIT